VDTITGFQYAGSAAGDRIILNTSFNSGAGLSGSIQVFESRGDGFLFGRIIDEAAGDLAANPADGTLSVDGGNLQLDGIYNTDGSGFAESFVLGGLDRSVDGTAALDNIDFSANGSFFFDKTTGGLYLGDGADGADLITVLEGVTINDGDSVNNLVTFQAIGLGAGDPGLQLF
jgi:hypothetical protein